MKPADAVMLYDPSGGEGEELLRSLDAFRARLQPDSGVAPRVLSPKARRTRPTSALRAAATRSWTAELPAGTAGQGPTEAPTSGGNSWRTSEPDRLLEDLGCSSSSEAKLLLLLLLLLLKVHKQEAKQEKKQQKSPAKPCWSRAPAPWRRSETPRGVAQAKSARRTPSPGGRRAQGFRRPSAVEESRT